MSDDGRTVWYPEDARWLSWERVVVLGEEFGAAAIAVLAAVKCEAKLQNSAWRVKAGWRSIAREAFVAPDVVHSVVARAAELGVLDDLVEDEFTFTARVSGMAASERKARDAARKAASRASSDTADTRGQDRTPADGSDAAGPREEERREEDRETTDVVSPTAGETKKTRTVAQDQLPDDLPEQLAPLAAQVLDRLVVLWDQRGGNQPTLRGVGLILRRFPDRDHLAVVDQLEHWALAGRGQRRQVKDWTATLATFLTGAAPGRPVVVPTASGERWRTMTDQPSEVPA